MLHHLSISVSSLKRSEAFYTAALAPLGYRKVSEAEGFVGYGTQQDMDKFALKKRVEDVAAPSAGFHIAFAANSHEAVNAFHQAAIDAGGRDNGAPGPRPHYGANYYAAFVVDRDGYEIEAVINEPV